jgi:curved DNA-binding protein CbpA
VEQFDPYVVLQVTPDADDSVIAAAYRALARRFHPDLAGDASTAPMRAINAAWELLRTPERRAAYDRERRRTGGHEPGRRAAAAWSRAAPPGTGAAGPPPGRPHGSVLPFGRHLGWSLGEVARVDPGYLEWLEDRPEGAPFRAEIDALLRRLGRRQATPPPSQRRGLWRRS